MEYYNIEQIVRISVCEAIISDGWVIEPLKSMGFLDSLIDRRLWKVNQKYPLYYNTSTLDGWYTPLNINEHLYTGEYIDEETLQVMEYPKVILFLTNGTSTIIHFKTYQSALDYAKKLASKSEHFIQLDKI